MHLSAGTKLGPYEIVAPLGSGGMGEVYRARDLALDRTVAIKVLPEAFAEDAERLARFEREAKLLASLNHPNIATLFGFDRAGSIPFLAMEMVPGETLAERITKGPLPLEEAVPFFVQIAHGLEDAHANGVVHRDLKPANIKLTPQGKIKILDFGLAKVFASSAEDGRDMANSPTISAGATLRGEVLGTASYMSPEQARGKEVDKRTDIWSFGCVLFEALTGISPFRGETITDTLAAIVRADPDWQRIPADTPYAIRRLLRRCLEKDVSRRLHDIADARIELEEAIAKPETDDVSGAGFEGSGALRAATSSVSGALPAVAVRAPSRRSMLFALGGTALAAAVIAVLATSAALRGKPAPTQPMRRFLIGSYDLTPQASPVFSPDGETIVFSATEGETRRLFRRSFRERDPVPIAGTEEATAPFFSPDGQWVGFATGEALKRVPLSGGAALTICNEPNINSADWADDGWIYFTPFSGGTDGGTALARVSEAGGKPERIAEIDVANGELECWLPEVLPGREWVLVSSRRTSSLRIEAISLKGGSRRVLVESAILSRYVPPNFLVVTDIESQSAVVIPFDAKRAELKGAPTPLTEVNLTHACDVTADGKIAYVPIASQSDNVVVWVTRNGAVTPLLDTPGAWMQPRLSSDGRRLVVRRLGYPDCDLWLYETDRHAFTRLTNDADSHDPTLSPDGRRVAFQRSEGESLVIVWMPLDGSGRIESLGAKTQLMRPHSWSQDARTLVAVADGKGTRSDIWLVPLDGGGEPSVYLNTAAREESPTISPDGKWIAYTSDESGRNEIYIRANPGPGPRVQASTEGGKGALWTRGGSEIVFASGRRMMAASFTSGPEPRVGVPLLLFTGDFSWDRQRDYDVMPDGSRFAIVRRPVGTSSRREIWIMLNWPAELAAHSTHSKNSARRHGG